MLLLFKISILFKTGGFFKHFLLFKKICKLNIFITANRYQETSALKKVIF